MLDSHPSPTPNSERNWPHPNTWVSGTISKDDKLKCLLRLIKCFLPTQHVSEFWCFRNISFIQSNKNIYQVFANLLSFAKMLFKKHLNARVTLQNYHVSRGERYTLYMHDTEVPIVRIYTGLLFLAIPYF